MRLVPDWRSAWRWLSIQITAVGIALQAAVLAWPDIKDWVGDAASHYIGIVILVGIAMGRLKAQPAPPCEPKAGG